MIGSGRNAMQDSITMIMRSVALSGMMVTGIALGGELQLSNGARIPGELKKIEATKVVWSAELIGDITIDKTSVVSLHTSTRSDLATAAGAVMRDCGMSSARVAPNWIAPGSRPRAPPWPCWSLPNR